MDDQKTLEAYIKQVSDKTADEDLPLVASFATSLSLKRGEQLLKEGEVCRHFYLVHTGHLRSCYDKDGIAINLNFTFEGSWVTNFTSVKMRQPSEIMIAAGEPTTVWIFSIDEMGAQITQYPQLEAFVRRLMFNLFVASEEHTNMFKMYTPTERYLYVENNNPRLLQRISLSQIASYLGVTRETLSRIRAKRQ